MKQIHFTVDPQKCVQCNACITDCPRHIISISDGLPWVSPILEANCLECQHCLAVCPTGAVSIFGLKAENSIELSAEKIPSASQMHTLLRGRRSVRQYSMENVPTGMIDDLLATLANTPTGCNDRTLSFAVVDDHNVMQKLRIRVIESIENKIECNELMPDFLSAAVAAYRQQGVDEIFRGAPHLLVVSAAGTASTPLQDISLALAYFELLAQCSGLGTTWCGFLKFAVDAAPELRPILGLDPETPFYAMLFGYPDVRYHRTVQRDNAAKIRHVSL
ncbi:nitroreductase family protein [uncultured Desulfovibrio sp.]|uniref:nitroreductase family protein n=1 Tax=uncultured Desulfovibrio sp. TaxID=167968 RepID=UPI0028685A34|nr:nitroreductase family protein [uncultured Desulfovibrio sp.]